MADFPSTLKIANTSKRNPRDGRVVDTDGDGLARIRKLHPDRNDFDLDLPGMLSGDKTALLAHYAANIAGTTFNFLWPPDGLTYVVKYGATPVETHYKGGRWTYKVKLLAGG